ncbi:Uncharacterised protein [Corynebacterium renale]|nr:Uncharacterised protein [Corynebacterium renale]
MRRSEPTASHPRCRNRVLMLATAGCFSLGAIHSPRRRLTTTNESIAEAVVAVSATSVPSAGPKRTPLAKVNNVRGIGNCVMATYSSQKTMIKLEPRLSAQPRNTLRGGTSKKIVQARKRISPALIMQRFIHDHARIESTASRTSDAINSRILPTNCSSVVELTLGLRREQQENAT